MGWACQVPSPGGTYTISTDIKFENTPTDTAAFAGLYVCCPTDDVFTDETFAVDKGYVGYVTAAGTLVSASSSVGGSPLPGNLVLSDFSCGYPPPPPPPPPPPRPPPSPRRW